MIAHCACVGHPCCCGGPELAEARAAIEARIRELLPGQAVRVVWAIGTAAVGDVLTTRSVTPHERAALRRALPDVRFPLWPRGCGYSLTMRGEVACGARPGRTSREIGGAWPAAEAGPRLVEIRTVGGE